MARIFAGQSRSHHLSELLSNQRRLLLAGLQITLSTAKLGASVGRYMKKPVPVESASALIDAKIKELGDWRGKMLAKVREIMHEADPEILEEWKWMGSPVWSRDGMIAVGNGHKDKVKLTFSNGASLPDPDQLFNAGFEGNKWRAIDFFEGDKVNERALKNLVRAAVAYNQSKLKRKTPAGTRAKTHKSKT